MAIPNVTLVQLINEGVTEATDPLDLEKDALKHISDNLCRPVGRVPEINYITPLPLTVKIPPVPTILNPILVCFAKSQNRLLVACYLILLYEKIGRNFTAYNIQWVPIISNFDGLYK